MGVPDSGAVVAAAVAAAAAACTRILVDYLAGVILVELAAREKRRDFTAHRAIVTPRDVLRCYKRESDRQ